MRLLHRINRSPRVYVHFYDGLLVAENGMLDVPDDHEQWIKRAWRAMGYDRTPDGRMLHDWNDVVAEQQYQKESNNVPSKRKVTTKS